MTKKNTKIIIYLITTGVMLISFSVFLLSFFNNQDDIFMDNFLLTIDIFICVFLLFCEFEIGNCTVYFLTHKKSRLNTIWKILSFSFSISWIFMLFVLYYSTNIFLSELLISLFTVLLVFSKLMCFITKNK